MTGRIEVSFASFEAPNANTGRIEVSWAGFSAPDAVTGNRILVSWAQLQAPDAAQTLVDLGDGKKRDLDKRDFEQRQDDWRADLRRIIERAFDEREEVTQAAPVEPLAKPDKRRMAQGILAQTNFGPLQLSLAEIIRQIDEYQQALVIEARRRDDEEAILMLMLSDA